MRKTLIYISISIILISTTLYSCAYYSVRKATSTNPNVKRQELLARRTYLIERIKEGAEPEQMPSFLPEQFRGEWALVTYSMTALALTNLAYLYPNTRKESLEITEKILQAVRTPAFRKFDTIIWKQDPLAPGAENYGHIGYLGHLNLILSAYAYLGGKKEKYHRLYSRISQGFRKNLKNSPIGNMLTYPGEVYIPDNIVAIASLALYERFTGNISRMPEKWLRENQNKYADATSGLLPFRISSSGQLVQGGRGSGAGWNIFFLYYINPKEAEKEYSRFKKYYLQDFYFGMQGFREWPHGNESGGDVDSGPLLFGFSPAGTGFGVAGAYFSRDTATLKSVLLSIEMIGTSFEWNGKRRYLLAPLVGDAAILAMRTTSQWNKTK